MWKPTPMNILRTSVRRVDEINHRIVLNLNKMPDNDIRWQIKNFLECKIKQSFSKLGIFSVKRRGYWAKVIADSQIRENVYVVKCLCCFLLVLMILHDNASWNMVLRLSQLRFCFMLYIQWANVQVWWFILCAVLVNISRQEAKKTQFVYFVENHRGCLCS